MIFTFLYLVISLDVFDITAAFLQIKKLDHKLRSKNIYFSSFPPCVWMVRGSLLDFCPYVNYSEVKISFF